MKTYYWDHLVEAEKQKLLRRPIRSSAKAQRKTVRDIITRVRKEGEDALLDLTLELDGAKLKQLEVTATEFNQAWREVDRDFRKVVERSSERIRAFHRAQLPDRSRVETADGVVCERVCRPIQRVGLYVPAGSAPLPSTALMLAIPASLACCPLVIMCSPPNSDGKIDPHVLCAARFCGVHKVFKLGGAQAIAAMAYGSESVPEVDKVFGPGNTWVTEAKQQVAMDPEGAAVDMPAGPSELLIVVDGTADPAFAAADLLSQTEHGPDSQVILVATDEAMAKRVEDEVARQIVGITRHEIAREALKESRTIIVRDRHVAAEVANRYAPEHLILQIKNPRELVGDIHAAGSVFLGKWTPEAIGDYCSGTNHVLPTYGYARNHSGLSVNTFLTHMTVQEATPSGLAEIGGDAVTMARIEGFDAHRHAVEIRDVGPRS